MPQDLLLNYFSPPCIYAEVLGTYLYLGLYTHLCISPKFHFLCFSSHFKQFVQWWHIYSLLPAIYYSTNCKPSCGLTVGDHYPWFLWPSMQFSALSVPANVRQHEKIRFNYWKCLGIYQKFLVVVNESIDFYKHNNFWAFKSFLFPLVGIVEELLFLIIFYEFVLLVWCQELNWILWNDGMALLGSDSCPKLRDDSKRFLKGKFCFCIQATN